MSHADALTQRFIDALTHRFDVTAQAHLVAGVSGGADSVAMLHLLIEARKTLPFALFIVHVNHQLRDADADADQRFVQTLCSDNGLACHCESIDVRADRAARGGSIEEAARRVRYEVFACAAQRFAATHLALAHHADDQAETVLFNLMRGASIHGLRGMPASRPLSDETHTTQLIRPLLAFRRDELRTFLSERHLAWREDATNQSSQASRNLLRNDVIPMLQTLQPAFIDSILSLAGDAASCESLVSAEATEALQSAIRSDSATAIPVEAFKEMNELVAGEVLRQMMLDAAVPGRRITRDLIGALRRLITEPPPASLDLPNAIRAWRSDTMLHVGMPPVCDAPEWSMQPVQFDRNTLQRFLRTKSDDEEFIDGDTLSGTLTLRRAHLGERFHPLGAPGTKTVGDFLTDQKVPTYQRPAWVLADDVGIVWLIGRRIDHRVRITDATRRIARLAAHART